MHSECISIDAGQLILNVRRAKHPISEILDFACRENPKRGFLFVSKILGKHIPVKPSRMRAIYDELAEYVGPGDDTYVVGMAETATGLGAGVADSLSRRQKPPVYYQHTTRNKLTKPIWLELDEIHSHAVDQLLYEPLPEYLEGIKKSKRLVLVDDEISTGRTIKQLAEKLLSNLSHVREIVIVSLVSWLSEETTRILKNFPVSTRFISLVEGEFSFIPNPEFSTQLPPIVDRALAETQALTDVGRFGLLMPYQGPVPDLNVRNSLTVVGDGEHLYLPFLAAERAEANGLDVLFQSTTRSPIREGQAIKSKLSFSIDERPVKHFIYNLADDSAREVVVLLEDEGARPMHQLARQFPASLRID